ncbi:MAG: PAS domain S-box protein, partial [Sulfurimonas sp.]|nr:PAS domain S-box protein [Sulfurimonas sp.]
SLSDIYRIVTTKKGSTNVFFHYTKLINSLLQNTKALMFKTNNKKLKNELIIYNDLNNIQETLGNIRAKVGLLLSSKKPIKEHIEEINRRNILFYHELETIFSNDIISSNRYARSISKTKCLKKTLLISKNIEKELNETDLKLSALDWFTLSTCAVDKISSYVAKQLKIIEEHIQKDIEVAKEERIKYIVFWIFGTVILAIFIFVSFKKSKELLKEHTLLENYKKAIDYSALVSKTNKDEIITYVNDNFCAISGYEKEELIGNKLTLLRDVDTTKKVSDSISSCLDNKKVWHGVLKNKNKNGDTYWVDTTITPIIDDKDNLIEYLAIRHDISDIILLNEEVQETQRELIYRLGEAVESRSKESGNHIKRVALYSKKLAQLANLSDTECETIFIVSSMHDVGKVAIPDSILLKPTKLTPEEWMIMKTHSLVGYNLFRNSTRPLLRAAAEIAYEHHEYYNGNGYPRGIKGKEISINGRIVAIADVYDALSSERVYKDIWTIDEIKTLFKKESGKQFDPNLIKLFLDNLDDFIKIRNDNNG